MHELLYADRIKGEKEIAVFRLALLVLMALMVALMVLSGPGLNLAYSVNIAGMGFAALYTGLLLLIIVRGGYSRAYGFASSTVDILLVSLSVYVSRYAAGSSLASLVSSSSFVVYFPVILFSIRRHDAANTLFTGLLAAASYGAMIVVMQVEGSFGVEMAGPGGLVIRNDLLNESLKALFLAASGAVGFGASRRFDRLFGDALAAVREKERIRDMFGRYVSEELVDKILAHEIAVEGEKREATVMFIDIRDFTPLAEKTDPRTLLTILNNFLGLSIATITRHGGFIDKFIGDAVMVVFGAPEPDEDHSRSAVACALELRQVLSTMNAWVRSLGVDWEFDYGIGINSGEVILGNIGTESRMEYTALGDTVNVASRIENLTRSLGRPILAGEACALACKRRGGAFVFDGPYAAALKGKSESVKVYGVEAG